MLFLTFFYFTDFTVFCCFSVFCYNFKKIILKKAKKQVKLV